MDSNSLSIVGLFLQAHWTVKIVIGHCYLCHYLMGNIVERYVNLTLHLKKITRFEKILARDISQPILSKTQPTKSQQPD